ncbi:MAG: acyltransferase [Paludibacteraceae bacterium]|nr:acyltransferase [Paludibacteraceae bacterium]
MEEQKQRILLYHPSAGRVQSIDILRSIALLGIILIHVFPPYIALRQLRNFDVPLMVFLSGVGLAYSRRSFDDIQSVLLYYWSRIQQILLPTWLFLGLYWGLMYILTSYVPPSQEVSGYITLGTYWYVWIMRVFLITALFAPLLPFIRRTFSAKVIVPCVVVILYLFEVYAPEMNDDWGFYLSMTIPYILIFAFGYVMDSLSRKVQIIIFILAAVLYAVFAIRFVYLTGEYQTTQISKYPPRLYYTSYAVMCIVLLWWGREWIVRVLTFMRLDKLFAFIGSHSMWIYFWHIIWLKLLEIYNVAGLMNAGGMPKWLFTYIVVLIGATLTTYLQNLTLQFLFSRCHNKSVNKTVETLFLR